MEIELKNRIVYLTFTKIFDMKTKFTKLAFIGFLLFSIVLSSCLSDGNKVKPIEEKEAIVLIETTMGDIKVKLYNETPLHRDNFIKLVKQNFYDSIIFHRVIKNFMIQGGDPTTKKPLEGAVYGEADTGYNIDAEFVDGIFHRKGALAAAREGDLVNPKKNSSGSQFYIVQGKNFTPEQLSEVANKKNNRLREGITNEILKNEANKRIFNGQNPDLKLLAQELKDSIDRVIESKKQYSFSKEQIEVYTTIGGTPHLDGDYTVFGEVIEGLDVVDKIAGVETNNSDRPLANIMMKMKLIVDISE
jgi:cyclophilin family peptidyl-prolyl cis-trans isomerase